MYFYFHLTQEEAGTQSVEELILGHTGNKRQNKDLGPTGAQSSFTVISSQA